MRYFLFFYILSLCSYLYSQKEDFVSHKIKANQLFEKEKFKKASSIYDDLLNRITFSADDSSSYFEILDNSIYCDYQLDDLDKGLNKCISAFKSINIKKFNENYESIKESYSWITYDLGWIYAQKAINSADIKSSFYEKSYYFFDESDSIKDKGYILVDYASSLALSGKNNKAISLIEKYFRENDVMGDNQMVFSLKTNLGIAYYNIGKYSKAKSIQEEIENFLNNSTLSHNYIVEYRLMNQINYNNTLDKLGEFEKSIKGGKSALGIANQIGQYENFIERNLAKSYFFNNQFKESLMHLEKVMSRLQDEEIKNDFNLGFVHKDLGEIYFKQGDYKNAISAFQKSIDMQEKNMNMSYSNAENYKLLSNAYFLSQNITETQKTLKKSIDIKKQILKKDEQYLPPENNLYYQRELLSNLFILYNSKIQNEQKIDLTDWYYLKNRELNMNNFYANKIKNSSDQKIKKNYNELLNLKKVYFELIQIKFLNQLENEKIKSLEKEINYLENEILNKLEFESKNQSIDSAYINSVLHRDEVFIDFMKLPLIDSNFKLTNKSNYYAFIHQKDKPVVTLHLGNENRIEKYGYSIYKREILNKSNSLSNVPYEVLFKKIDQELDSGKYITIYPDGVFNFINFYSLYNEKDGNYVFEYRDIRVINSYKSIGREDNSFAISTEDKIDIFSNPNYSSYNANDSNKFEFNSRNRAFRGGYITPLPGTKIEGEAIKNLFQGNGNNVGHFESDNASEENLKNLRKSNIIHIATHGYYFNEEEFEILFNQDSLTSSNPYLLSGLLLSGAQRSLKDNTLEGNNGWLSSLEIQTCDLSSTKLIVLSACETLLGDTEIGRGVFGLNQALKNAGVKNIISSLWKVDDEATVEFMLDFYKELIDNNDIHYALKSAMANTKKKYPHPYYWGPFIYVE